MNPEMTTELAIEIASLCVGKENVRTVECMCGNVFVGWMDPTECPVCHRLYPKFKNFKQPVKTGVPDIRVGINAERPEYKDSILK